MGKYIIALLVITVGSFLIVKTEWFIQNFGTNAWAEEHMGSSGGSRLMYKLIGLAFIFLALMGVTGMLGEVIISVFGRLFGL
ncbi:MAG TPA: hypothetical protein DEB09_03145 [Candidatus Magasanikbacteria bacterium]|nr:hypothetical protein [Candidatus Magasanikbacteria bacterium]